LTITFGGRDMSEDVRPGRIVGVLVLAQMVCGALVNFRLEAPLFGPPGYLVSAAPHAAQIAAAALLGLANDGLALAIAIIAFPVIRRHASALSIGLVALAATRLAVSALEQINVLSMLSLSQAYTAATAAERVPFETLRGIVAASRNGSHFVGLILSGAWLFVFYAALWRSTLVPRALAAFGLVAVALQIGAVTTPLFGQAVDFRLLLPLGVSQLILCLWLMARGFRLPMRA
jgi:hypothetical protein